MDTITYTKQGDGSFTKLITHTETSTDLDKTISIATNSVAAISSEISALELQLKLKQGALASAQANLDGLTSQNDAKIATRKTFTEETDNVDIGDEVAVLEATIVNLQAGTTTDADAQAQIDSQIANLQDCLITLKS